MEALRDRSGVFLTVGAPASGKSQGQQTRE
jgi:hypothetical protein